MKGEEQKCVIFTVLEGTRHYIMNVSGYVM